MFVYVLEYRYEGRGHMIGVYTDIELAKQAGRVWSGCDDMPEWDMYNEDIYWGYEHNDEVELTITRVLLNKTL
jgi:hypothetical protein